MRLEDIVIGELVCECLKTRSDVAGERGVALEIDLEDPGAILYGDRRLLMAAMTNMVDIAIMYNRPGGRITVGHHSDQDRESIVVVDNGRGLHYEDLRSVRDLFCRAAMQGNYEVEEIDPKLLGFSVVKDIADLHGGRIGVQSVEGEGSTFTLHLPRRRRRIA
jgi:signal transduction histidine kinase